MDGKRKKNWPRKRSSSMPPSELSHAREHGRNVERLLESWQVDRQEQTFDELIHRVTRLVNTTSRQSLLRYNVRDLNAVDDVFSLVLDHLRRLAGCSNDELVVAAFDPLKYRCDCSNTTACKHDAGMAYVCWLARSRAADVARQRHRDTTASLCELDERHQTPVDSQVVWRRETFDRVLGLLDERSQQVLTLLADGHTQAEIAARLRVCEGTVSRIRSRGIQRAREYLGLEDSPTSRKPR